MVLWYAALLGVTLVVAESICNKSSITISFAADASGLRACPTFTGDITIATNFPDNRLELDALEVLDGSLYGDGGTSITFISAPKLRRLTGQLRMIRMPKLTEIDLPELRELNSLLLSTLPVLDDVVSKNLEGMTRLTVMSTGLRSLNNIRSMETGASIVLTGNLNLNDVSMAIESAGLILIQSNGYTLTVDFPTLQRIGPVPGGRATFNNCSSLSLPSLGTVKAPLLFAGNFFDRLHLPEIQAVESLEVVDNARLTNISMPTLDHVLDTGIRIARNPKLRTMDLSNLASVAGSMLFSGNLDKIYLPSLQTVTGNVVLDGISTISRLCTPYSPVEGQYKLGDNAGLCNGGSSKRFPRQAKIGIGVGVFCVAFIVVGCTLALLVARRQRRRNIPAGKTLLELHDSDFDINMLDNGAEKHELQSPVLQLPVCRDEAQELPGQHGRTELHRNTSPSRVPLGIESRHEMPAKGVCTPRRFSFEKSPVLADED